jgi:type IV pilus assembly protein PilV
MEPNVHSSNSGFTLLEILVALVIMTVGLLGILQTANVALLHTLSNQLRNDAIIVADEQMVLEMTKPFDLISASASTQVVQRTVYNALKNFTVIKTVTNVTARTKSIALVVQWTNKGENFSHTINSLISKSSK